MQWIALIFCLFDLKASTIPYNSAYVSNYFPDRTITESFNVPRGLEMAVDFWIKVYAEYDTNQLLLHDTEYHVIYEVVDVSDIQNLPYFSDRIKDEIIDSRIARLQKKYMDALRYIHSNKDNKASLDAFQESVYDKFSGISDEEKFLNASRPGRIRIQRGQRSRFQNGLYQSARYLPFMEKIFKKYNLPPELTRLPFVESYFNPRAFSWKAASGIWQFMRYTAKSYLTMTPLYDERNDPIISTIAAAKFLKNNFRMLKSWPLAVTAYNHGPYGIQNAVRRLGSESIVHLIRNYEGDSFGFASKNFYAEFLAALYVEKNYQRFFGRIDFATPLDYGFIVTVKAMRIHALESIIGVNRSVLKEYNPAISSAVFEGRGLIPKGARIRVPYNKMKNLLSDNEQKRKLSGFMRFI